MIHFQLVTLKGKVIDEPVYEVIMPSTSGAIAVYEDHTPLVTDAAPGIISVRKKREDSDEELLQFATQGGLVEIDGKSIRFLADEAVAPDEISIEEAEKALARARQLAEEAGDSLSLQQAQLDIDRQMVRLKLANIKKRKH